MGVGLDALLAQLDKEDIKEEDMSSDEEVIFVQYRPIFCAVSKFCATVIVTIFCAVVDGSPPQDVQKIETEKRIETLDVDALARMDEEKDSDDEAPGQGDFSAQIFVPL